MHRFIWTLLACALFVFRVEAQVHKEEKIPAFPVLLQAHILDQGGEHFLGLSYQNKPHWHTYWKNPGDAGLPFKNEILNNGEQANLTELEWPAPKTFMSEGDILGFGYEGEYTLFYKLPKDFAGNLVIHSNWLVCKHICIPGKGEINVNVKKGQTGLVGEEKFELSLETLSKRMQALPKLVESVDGFKLELIKGDEPKTLKLAYQYQGGSLPEGDDNLLMPFGLVPFEFKRETLNKSGNVIHGSYTIAWDGEYEEPEQNLDAQGNLPKDYELSFLLRKPSSGEVVVIKQNFKEAKKSPSFAALTINQSATPQNPISVDGEGVIPSAAAPSMLAILFFAFIGGLILNIMPCVLPVISLKLFGLLRHAGDSKKLIFRHNIFYSLGVLTTFLFLAISVLALKATGEAVGWGFQLQSPIFVAIMALVIFIMSLNLFGLFEFSTPGGRKLGGVTLKDSFVGDFLGGVLATILSTPCSAPFLGTALTVAFSNGPIAITSIFLMIGLGLASPFILTAFFPALVRFLPKPGAWMEHVKKFLGLILVLTTLWLLDVFSALVDGSTPLLKLQTTLVFTFFAIYAIKKMLRRKVTKTIFAAIPVLLLVSLFTSPLSGAPGVAGESVLLVDKKHSGLPWESWSEDKMNGFRQNGSRAFIDFTAKWCFTCKVNEKLVLDSQGFKDLHEKYGAKLLLADWTKKDPVITAFLEKNKLVGVPAYFVIDSKGDVHNLGETITIAEIEKAMSL